MSDWKAAVPDDIPPKSSGPSSEAALNRAITRIYEGVLTLPYTEFKELTLRQLREALPFDSGVGAGRNALIDAVSTEYLWMADDDMILLPDFDIDRVRAELQGHGVVLGAEGLRYGASGQSVSIYLTDPDGNALELRG